MPPLPRADGVGPGNLVLPLLPPSSPRWPLHFLPPLLGPCQLIRLSRCHSSPGLVASRLTPGLPTAIHTTRDIRVHQGFSAGDDPAPRGRWATFRDMWLSRQEVHLASSGGARVAAHPRTPPRVSRARGDRRAYEFDGSAALPSPLPSRPVHTLGARPLPAHRSAPPAPASSRGTFKQRGRAWGTLAGDTARHGRTRPV